MSGELYWMGQSKESQLEMKLKKISRDGMQGINKIKMELIFKYLKELMEIVDIL